MVSLGICTVRGLSHALTCEGLSVSDRERPLVTGVNGLLMARPSLTGLYKLGLWMQL